MRSHYLRRNRHGGSRSARWIPSLKPVKANQSKRISQSTEGIPMNDIIARYLDCWNETDPVARRQAIEEVGAADAEYIAPIAEARGREQIYTLFARAQIDFSRLV